MSMRFYRGGKPPRTGRRIISTLALALSALIGTFGCGKDEATNPPPPNEPDLVITTSPLGSGSVSRSAGDTLTLAPWVVRNQGVVVAPAFQNGFYLSSDGVITSSDVFLGGTSNSGLAVGDSTVYSAPTITIPASTPPGLYSIGYLVDRGGAVTELDEGNNYSASLITVDVAMADLYITSGTPVLSRPTVASGDTFTIVSEWRVRNRGAVSSGPFENGFFLSTDAIITFGDTYLGGVVNPNLAAGDSTIWAGPFHLTIPGGTPAGSYYVGILADRADAVSESNEANNYVSVPVTVTP